MANTLFRILELHGAPKDTTEFTRMFVIADSDEGFAERVNSEFKCYWEDEEPHVDWKDGEETEEDYMLYMQRIRGSYHDPDANWDDAYYGITHVGWDEGVPIEPADAETLIRLELALDWR